MWCCSVSYTAHHLAVVMAMSPHPRSVALLVRLAVGVRAEAGLRASLCARVHVACHLGEAVKLEACVAAHCFDPDRAAHALYER